MHTIESIAGTLRELATPGMGHKDLVAAVRKRHAEASKKDVVRAAFFLLTEAGGLDSDQARRLHGFALTERTADEDGGTLPPRRIKRPKRRSGGDAEPRAATEPAARG